jgi:general secretion pathway protein I
MAFRRNAGFTLVEVMVAMMIVALALPALLDQAQSLSNHTFVARAKTQAYWVAQNKMAEISLESRLTGKLPSRKDRGTVELGRDRWEWRFTTEETGVEGMLRLDMQVSRAGQEGSLARLTGFVRGT